MSTTIDMQWQPEQIQWLWFDMGMNHLINSVLTWGDNPVINLADKNFYTYFNINYLGEKPFQHLYNIHSKNKAVSKKTTSIPPSITTPNIDNINIHLSSTTAFSEILQWVRAGRNGAGANPAMAISDISAYFQEVILPLILTQCDIDTQLLQQYNCLDHVIIVPMLDTHDSTISTTPNIVPTLYMAVINVSTLLSRKWLQQPEMILQSTNMLLDMLPGIERSQLYGPISERYNIKDCLTATQFNLAAAIHNYFYHTHKDHIFHIPISYNNSTNLISSYYPISASELFNKIKIYFPSCVVVWTNHTCNDIISTTNYTTITTPSTTDLTTIDIHHDKDSQYKLAKRKDKIKSNNAMLAKNAVLARMLYLNIKTTNEIRRNAIVRSPLFITLEKKRDKQHQSIYKKYCGSSSYHYITHTHQYRSTQTTRSITSPQKLDNATNIAIDEALACQLARIELN